MIILAIKTDQPMAQFDLFKDRQHLAGISYLAHKDLAATIHLKLQELLASQDFSWDDLGGLVAFEGPGSFTGLRIGLSVANTLAYSLKIPIVGSRGRHWQETGLGKLLNGQTTTAIMPYYGASPHITKPRK